MILPWSGSLPFREVDFPYQNLGCFDVFFGDLDGADRDFTSEPPHESARVFPEKIGAG